MVILPNMAKTVKRPLFHYFFAFFHILRCPYHGFSGHRVFLTHFWGCMRGGLWVLCAEVQKSQNASPVLKVLPPPTPPPTSISILYLTSPTVTLTGGVKEGKLKRRFLSGAVILRTKKSEKILVRQI